MVWLIVAAAFLMAGFVGYLAWRQERNTRSLLGEVAERLDFEYGKSIGNALFEYPSAVGRIRGLPVFVGTSYLRTRGRDNFFLQVVVGRHRDANVRPMPVGSAAEPQSLESYGDVLDAVENVVDADKQRDSKGSLLTLTGGSSVGIYDDVIERTFSVNGIQSQRWARRVIGTAHVLAAYAEFENSPPSMSRE